MDFASNANKIFDQAVADYHKTDSIDALALRPYCGGVDAILYAKCWIDAAQWHMEDIIRVPDLDPAEAIKLKRRIDRSNKDRTDMVEDIDTYFRDLYRDVEPLPDAGINTESPAWAIDRLSILSLKIWHMREQADRTDAGEEHRATARGKLAVLLEQRQDLSEAIDRKLYNDPATNPELYKRR